MFSAGKNKTKSGFNFFCGFCKS